MDQTQPNPPKTEKSQPNPTHGSTQPMDNSETHWTSQWRTYADNVALPAFARRAAVRRAALDRYLLPAGPQQQTDRRTDAWQVHRPCSAGSANKMSMHCIAEAINENCSNIHWEKGKSKIYITTSTQKMLQVAYSLT